MMIWLRWISCVLVAAVWTACDLPRDSDGTLNRVRGGAMRVGVVVDTPWTTDSAGMSGGIEGQIVQSLARELNARVQWIPGRQDELLAALQHRELDLVIGGLNARSPWSKQVAFTRPYYTDTVRVGGAPNADPPASLEKVTVALTPGDPAAAQVREQGGVPRFVSNLADASLPVAAPTWRLAQLSRRENPALTLLQTPHVLAAAPGENAWLVRIEQMLIERQDQIPQQLRQASR
jgi:polar amino acid transport system substrate-binding protein